MASQQDGPLPPDTDHRHEYMAAIIVFTVIAVVIAWLRMYTRMFISRNAWWDDWVMFIGTFLTILTNGILIRAFELGLGRHIYYVPKEQIPECFKWLWAAEPTNLFALYTVRLSITLFFLRLIPTHHKRYRHIIWASIWGLTISDIYVSVNYFIQCRPIEKVWRPETPGECLSDAVYAAAPWVYQAVSILADLALMSIPILMFRSLNLPLRTKIGVIVLCCLGVFTCAIAVVKTALLPALFDHHNKDKTWSLAQLCFWAPMEICVGMICGSLPCLKPLYHRIKGGTRIPSQKSSSYASGFAGIMDGSRAKNGKSSANEFINLEDRSKSEDSILPRNRQHDDIELCLKASQQSDGELSAPKDILPTTGILRTTELQFRSETSKKREDKCLRRATAVRGMQECVVNIDSRRKRGDKGITGDKSGVGKWSPMPSVLHCCLAQITINDTSLGQRKPTCSPNTSLTMVEASRTPHWILIQSLATSRRLHMLCTGTP
ncbi:hypothetical protein DM02DRAFT_702580 [Periconia macrospinosa]|uniref:Rhodopsin domain-containing protein n=1 Tax=Periconia macrospinosa TaxID=97972 RepID=A0A2V1D1H0_9PLEO|nr:hypothetical protein DM02DRAFT_702580 [Periconia macrospinosa]